MGSLPSVHEIDDLLQLQQRNHEALMRIRNAVLSQEQAMAEQRAQRRERIAPGYDDGHVGHYQDGFKSPTGLTGGDAKKRRGVGFLLFPSFLSELAIDINFFFFCRKQLLLGGATVAIERKRRNGGVDPMEPVRCATRVVFTMPSSPEKWGQTRQRLWDRISSPRALILRHQCTDSVLGGANVY